MLFLFFEGHDVLFWWKTTFQNDGNFFFVVKENKPLLLIARLKENHHSGREMHLCLFAGKNM